MIKHGLLYLLAKLVTGSIGFVSLFLYTHLLYPDEYGRYATVLIYVSVASALLYQWFRLGLIRFVPKYAGDESQYRRLLRTVAAGYVGMCLLSAGVGAVLLLVTGIRLTELACALLLLWTSAWFELSQALQRSNLQPVRFGIMATVKSVLIVALSVLFIEAGYGETGLLYGIAAGTAAANLLFSSEWKGIKGAPYDKRLAAQILLYGLPLMISGSMAYVMQSIDRLMIGWLMSDADAGVYAAGYDFSFQTVGMLMMVVNLSALPLAIRKLEQQGEHAAREQMSNNYQLLLLIAVPSVTGITLLSSNLTAVIFGEHYAGSLAAILPIISFMMLVQGIKLYYTDVSYQLGRTTYWQVVPVALGILLNIGLHYTLIPIYGLKGAAVSSLIASALMLAANIYITQRLFRLPYSLQALSRILLAALMMGLALLPVAGMRGPFGLAVQAATGAAVYAVALVVLNEFQIRTKLMARARKRLETRLSE
ncbi:lipopolysaccharide biosynthesis protein [Paenibacillus kobensis]|uniref:lipopolysaccharide biosynthesis protein n=1 Tax=Paenibacillus kobensis TaxID=59841 RepID=UPI000FD952BC|nr:oligosaccharide flippase family protein [Paenibacillus kobensis]